MKKFSLFLCLFFVFSSVLYAHPSPAHAEYRDCDPAKDGLPLIPVSVDKNTADRTDTIGVTLHFEDMSQEDFNRYENISVVVNVYNGNEPLYDPEEAVSDFFNRDQINQTLTLSNSTISETQSGNLAVGILNECDGGLGTPSIPIQIDVNQNQASRIPTGGECDPDKQDDPENPQFKCAEGSPCRQSDVSDINGNKYYCGGRKPIENPPTPTPLPPPPPCRDTNLSQGCGRIDSALGILATDPQGFITKLFGIFLSLSGGIALLFIIRSGYQLMTSQGNPEKVKEAQERITSAIVGLLFIIFSLVVLQVIGVDILALPGLGK